jgi:hypothetical protein
MCCSCGRCPLRLIMLIGIMTRLVPGADPDAGTGVQSGGGLDAVAQAMVFQATGSTAVARDAPYAVTLPTGQVLVAGGRDAQGMSITACELYDPTSGQWTPTAALAHGHGGGVGVLLPSGHVLLAGGDPDVEVFDPVTARWSAAGTLSGQTIALCVLGDGDVLATIGSGAAMRWSEATMAWNAVSTMPSLASGNGLIALPDGGALAYGGFVSGDSVADTAACSRFDPKTGQWTVTASMGSPRAGAAAVLVAADTVLVLGGYGNGDDLLDSCESYTISSGTWAARSNPILPIGSGGCATQLVSGLVLVTGGDADGVVSDQAQCYDPQADSWSLTPLMLAAHADHACAALPDGGALIIDGLTTGAGGIEPTSACERYQVLVVNAPPSFVLGADVAVDENGPALDLAGWMQGIIAGPLFDETVSFQLTVDAPELFSVLPAIAADGTLTGTVAPDVSGTATVTVWARNSGGTAAGGTDTSAPQTFTITVAFVNQPPSWVPGPSPTVNENSGLIAETAWATGISPGPANQAAETVAFTLSCDHPEYFSVPPQLTPDGTLSFTPASGRFGLATINAVLANSGGTARGGQDASAPVSFTIGITRVIQQPVVPPVTLCDLVGYTVSAPTIISDPDQLLSQTATPTYQVTGICHLGQVSIAEDGQVSVDATAVGAETVAFQVTVAGAVLMSDIVVVVTDVAAPRPQIVSVPAVEWGVAGAPWVYDLTVSPASLSADADLVVSIQSAVPALMAATSTNVSGSQVRLVVPALDPAGGSVQRLLVVAVDRVSQTVDIQVILLVVLGSSAAG